MKTKLYKYLLICVFIYSFCACSDDNIIYENHTIEINNPDNLDYFDNYFEPDDSCAVRTKDIIQVISKFGNGSDKHISRSTNYSIDAIFGNDEKPSIYVVNFLNNNGFILLSATKNICPILAYSNKGYFDLTNIMPNGLIKWKENIISTIKWANEQPYDSIRVYREQWRSFEDDNFFVFSPNSRYATDEELLEAQAILNDSINSWRNKGYSIYDITGNITGDENIDQEMRDKAYEYTYYLYLDNWESVSVAIRKTENYTETFPNFVLSKWAQNNGYNATFPTINGRLTVAGCGPVAIGQVMRFFEYPATFNWNNMPYNTPTNTTSNLLYDIATKANATLGISGTSVSSENITTALRAFGYSAELVDFNINKVWNNIRLSKPVVVFGTPSGYNSGHIWIISGAIDHYNLTCYEVYTFGGRNRLDCAYRDIIDSNAWDSFYMNWGWGGSNDGFYVFPTKIPGYSVDTDYNKILYNITPQS